MKPIRLKQECDSLADTLMSVASRLEAISSEVRLSCDGKAIDGIVTDLHWAAENCTVIGLHQIDKALDDNMGTGVPVEERKASNTEIHTTV
jgi:hypothetical protein